MQYKYYMTKTNRWRSWMLEIPQNHTSSSILADQWPYAFQNYWVIGVSYSTHSLRENIISPIFNLEI